MSNQFRNIKRKKPNPPKASKSDLTGGDFNLKSIKGFLKSKRFKKTLGLLLILFSVFLIVSFVSYFFTWQKDNHLVGMRSFDLKLIWDSSLTAENALGRFGAVLSNLFIYWGFGFSSFLFALLFFNFGFKLLFERRLLPGLKTFFYSLFIMVWLSILFGFLFKSSVPAILGGVFGHEANNWLRGAMGNVGIFFLLVFSLIGLIIIAFNPNLSNVPTIIGNAVSRLIPSRLAKTNVKDGTNVFKPVKMPVSEAPGKDIVLGTKPNDDFRQVGSEEDNDFSFEVNFGEEEPVVAINPIDKELGGFKTRGLDEIGNESGKITGANYEVIDDPSQFGTNGDMPDLSHLGPYDPTLDLPDYKVPDLSLLEDYGSSTIQVNKQELEANKNKIIETLNNYSIQIDRIKATIGPTVTLYEIIPAPGVRISKIKNLENDIALSLAALGIRIIAPIPGKGTIGIEVPNANPEIVSMRSILASERFQNSHFELPIGLGKTIANETYIADLTKMPHLLMAGATGQGKSVGLNAIITSILYKKHPSQVKFVLVDPKKVELTLFSKIARHFLAKLPDLDEAIVTETKEVTRTINSLTIEMDNRYDLFKDAQVRNIKEYNAKFIERRLNPRKGHKFLPYIVVFVDEFADLIMTAGKEIELPIARLAQLARAVGIHLVIATQRPSVNIITGTIKANFPARVAFKVTSKIDSRTILDTGGADQLIGRGDMLLSSASNLIRLQCAFIDTHEIDKITDFIGSQRAYPEPFALPEYFDDESGADQEVLDPAERDEMFEEAARLVVASQQGSTSLIQRKLKLGYNRAGRIVDQLEAAGIVGPFEGSKAREVRIKDPMTLEQILRGNA